MSIVLIGLLFYHICTKMNFYFLDNRAQHSLTRYKNCVNIRPEEVLQDTVKSLTSSKGFDCLGKIIWLHSMKVTQLLWQGEQIKSYIPETIFTTITFILFSNIFKLIHQQTIAWKKKAECQKKASNISKLQNW